MNEPVVPAWDGGLVRLRLDIAYDGTDFSGWAAQPERRTVHGVLGAALTRLLRQPVSLTVAGRTDAGVHALGQVAHLDVAQATWDEIGPSLVRRLAGVLPLDVRVRSVTPVPAQFDARFSALWRRYHYRITDDVAGAQPLRRFDTLAWRRTLAVDLMQAAALLLLGEHDFVAYCRRREGASTVRGLQRFDVARRADTIEFDLTADAFCHSMVRSLVGALIAVGEQRRPVEWPAAQLARTDRANDVGVAPAHGLTLVEVGYPPNDQLSARQAITRNVRTMLDHTDDVTSRK
jgi:tRNA pseudouridine38-40 synthase